ncbi:MAG: AAA family ATPase [Acidimicrobiia bacterium]
MQPRITSLQFVGRSTELDRLTSAFKTAAVDERATLTLLGGEAGVGKTRLVTELAAKVHEIGGTVFVGSCLDLADPVVPYGPIVQVLRSVQRTLDAAALETVIGGAGEFVGRLVPELHPVRVADDRATPGALFEHLLGVVERLGDRAPALLILEDLHWADRSTRDLLVYLARNLDAARVSIVGTYRSDDLHRRHPLRSVLAELDRSGSVQRFELPRFDHEELREMISSILGSEPPADLLDAVYERSEGNAFFAEELVASRDSSDRLPTTLRDILLARIDTLSSEAQHLLGLISVIGRRADHRLVAALADRPDEGCSAGLRDAMERQILLVDDDGTSYSFRHTLVGEVVYDDLLPGERVRLHSHLAEILTEHPEWCEGGTGALASELARHWSAARDTRRALPATLNAAREAERMYAYPEALEQVERSLEMWQHTPDAAELCGMRLADVMTYAAALADATSRIDRAVEFLAAAAELVDERDDPVTAALLHELWARYLRGLGAPVGEILDHVDRAVALVPPTASAARARVLATRGQQLMLAGLSAEAVAPCEDAIALAREVGDPAIESHARNSLGVALAVMGGSEEGLVHLRRAREQAEEAGAWDDVVRACTNECSVLSGLARHIESCDRARTGLETARRRGLSSHAVCLRLVVCAELYALGSYDELRNQLDHFPGDRPGLEAWNLALLSAQWSAVHGDFDAAREQLQRFRTLLGREPEVPWLIELRSLEVELALWEGALDTAIECGTAGMSTTTDLLLCADSISATALPLNAMAAAVRLASGTGARNTNVRARAVTTGRKVADRLHEWIDAERWGSGRPGDIAIAARQVDAEQASLEGHPEEPEAWSALANEWSSRGMHPRAAYTRWREAEERLAVGDRPGARDAALAAFGFADGAGWSFVRDGVTDLARRARLDIGLDDVVKPADPMGLTTRELAVLALVAEGRTNRQIADALFISVKTASAHVSSLLGKLGVTNRGEAGAAARRLGLV